MEEMRRAFGPTDRDIENERFPMRQKLVQHEQNKDKEIQEKLETKQSDISLKNIEGYTLVHYRDKIYVPKTLKKRILEWYHTYLAHLGVTRMTETLQQLYY